jgi:hypothetical protein
MLPVCTPICVLVPGTFRPTPDRINVNRDLVVNIVGEAEHPDWLADVVRAKEADVDVKAL